MSEQSFEELLNEEGAINRIHNGAIVTGTVIDVKENEAILCIKSRSEARLLELWSKVRSGSSRKLQ